MRSVIASLIVLSGVAYADVTRRACFVRYLVGTGIVYSTNVTSVSSPSTGTYTVTLTKPCEFANGYASTNNTPGGARRCSANFTATNVITVTCYNSSDNLTNLTNGDTLGMIAYCATP